MMHDYDLERTRAERRANAKAAAAASTPERRLELASQTRKTIATKGRMMAASMPVDPSWRSIPDGEGQPSEWMFPVGSGKTRGRGSMPKELAPGGWMYLRADDRLVARVRFIRSELRAQRIEHVASEAGREDRGTGYVLVVDPNSWDTTIDVPTAPDETGNGYRYYRIDRDGNPIYTRLP